MESEIKLIVDIGILFFMYIWDFFFFCLRLVMILLIILDCLLCYNYVIIDEIVIKS